MQTGFIIFSSGMYVCVCLAVTEAEVDAAIADGAHTRVAVTRACRAGGDCGACHGMIEHKIEEHPECAAVKPADESGPAAVPSRARSGAGSALVSFARHFPGWAMRPYRGVVGKRPLGDKAAALIVKTARAMQAASAALVANPEPAALAIQKQFFAKADPAAIIAAIKALNGGVAGGGKLDVQYSEIGDAQGSYEHCDFHINSASSLSITHSNIRNGVYGMLIGGTTHAIIQYDNLVKNGAGTDLDPLSTNTNAAFQ